MREIRRRAPTVADWLLLGTVALLIPASWAWRHPAARPLSLEVRTATTRLRLDPRQSTELALAGPVGVTRLCVRDGAVWISAAPCRNQLCRRLGRIRGAGRSLVCVPNAIVVRLAAADADVDGVTH